MKASNKVHKYPNQEERYRNEIDGQYKLADSLLAALATPTATTEVCDITQWACRWCGMSVNGRWNYCPECGKGVCSAPATPTGESDNG